MKSFDCLVVGGVDHGKRYTFTTEDEYLRLTPEDYLRVGIPIHYWINETDGKYYMIATDGELNSSEISLAISETDPPLKSIY
ncbi:hypothetical protein CE143_14840 [Photorhabdus luminescens]|uniref:Uncharacterized protein n=1 Tax=Photorhabdus akhurstii TaxID=171438 RepID=A0ABX8LYR8_9GAMM|nr:hypothetical protein [Photorhabdus akhurstii]QXF34283.1 hypothetical protein B0X70_14845 [Photorhabdus akhurstii]UJD76107.1 hypothetical protein CE143_14840 [Photorhabdus luminescens]